MTFCLSNNLIDFFPNLLYTHIGIVRNCMISFIVVMFAYCCDFVLIVVKEWEKREIPEASEKIKENSSILKYVCGLKKDKPFLKVFLQDDNEDAKRFFRTQVENIYENMQCEFVNVNDVSEIISEKDEEIEQEERNAPEIPEATGKILNEIIASEGEKIYAKHSIVVGIGVSNIISKHPKACRQPCIVLYCLDTDLTPYGEKPLPYFINGYPCDVREELCLMMVGTCKDCKKLNPGCDIGCDIGSEISTGSAGFLVNGQIKGFLTAAHVVQNVDQIYIEKSDSMDNTISKHEQITHPSDSSEVIGEVENYICGNYWSFGSDIAIVRAVSVIDKQQGNQTCIENLRTYGTP